MNHEHAYVDLAHAIAHAGPDDLTEDAEGYVTWDGRSPNAMDSTHREEA